MSKAKNILKLGRISTIYNGSTPETGNSQNWDGEIPWITPADLKGDKYVSYGKRNITETGVKSANLVPLPKNTVLLTSRAPIGKVALAQNTIHTNQGFKNIVLNETFMLPEFLYYFLFISEEKLNVLGKGTTFKEISKNDVASLKVPCPEINIQKKIVKKLNALVKKINSITFDTKQSIEELKKYKQSIITETVTKGLNSNVKMKDSEIEWIGKVPEAWDVIKINRLFSIKKEIANKTGYDVLSVTQRGLKVKDITQNEGQMAADYSKYQIVQPDDFVMNHMDLLTGWVDLSVQEGVTSPDYRVFYNKQKELVLNKFYLYVFQICYLNKNFYGLGQGVSNFGRWRLQTDKFLNFYLPLPTIEEQKEIVSFLDSQTNKVDKLIQEKERAIEELDKYKQSLIYEYITGKKEV